jgi:hypothetical protein
MTGRGILPVELGTPSLAPPKILDGRKAVVKVASYAEGWRITAARRGQMNNPHGRFEAIVWRCLLGAHCDKARCLGHHPAVLGLADKIKATYR